MQHSNNNIYSSNNNILSFILLFFNILAFSHFEVYKVRKVIFSSSLTRVHAARRKGNGQAGIRGGLDRISAYRVVRVARPASHVTLVKS